MFISIFRKTVHKCYWLTISIGMRESSVSLGVPHDDEEAKEIASWTPVSIIWGRRSYQTTYEVEETFMLCKISKDGKL